MENALPYAIRLLEDGVMQTIGAYSYTGKLRHPFTAHPKIDPTRGEVGRKSRGREGEGGGGKREWIGCFLPLNLAEIEGPYIISTLADL